MGQSDGFITLAGSSGKQELTVDFEEPASRLDPMFDTLMKGVLDKGFDRILHLTLESIAFCLQYPNSLAPEYLCDS